MDKDALHWEAAEEGAELLAEGQAEHAIAVLKDRIIDDPTNPYAYYFLGAAHFELERWEHALKAYLTAIELAPEYLGAMVGAGHCLRMMGKHREALRLGRQILERKSDDADALYLMGLVHFQRGEEAAAEKFLEAFLGTHPEAETLLEVQGMLEVIRGRVSALDPDALDPDESELN